VVIPEQAVRLGHRGLQVLPVLQEPADRPVYPVRLGLPGHLAPLVHLESLGLLALPENREHLVLVVNQVLPVRLVNQGPLVLQVHLERPVLLGQVVRPVLLGQVAHPGPVVPLVHPA